MKLTQLIKENHEEPKKFSPQVKKHFLEIVSTYNKYQESMDRKSDLAEIAETLGGITEAAKTLLLGESDDWFDKVTIKRNMSELEKLGKEFDKVAMEANSLDQRLNGLYEDMGHIISRYYKMGEISEEQMKERLGMNESVEDCGCNNISEVAINEADVVGKTIFSDGKGKLFFGYYKTDDGVTFVDYKTWKKLSFKDVSKGDMNKERVIKAIIRNQKQFNKKVEFNMWAKQKKRTFEETMDWFIQNGWISNINKGGIKESVNEISYDSQGNLKVKKQYKSVSDYEKVAKKGDYVWIGNNINDFKKAYKSHLSKVLGTDKDGNVILTPFGRNKKYTIPQKNQSLIVAEGIIEEENCPTDPGKWSYYKSQAKKKFDVYPSAYANGWASKQYKAAGGGWKKCS